MVARSSPPALKFAAPAATTSTHAALASVLRARLDDARTVYVGPGCAAALRCLVLAMICARPINVLLVGPPGTNKSGVADALATWVGALFMDTQFSPWSDVADLIGAVDIAALQRGIMARVAGTTARPTLGNAHMANFDELPRGAPGLLAAVLRPLAERRMPTGEPLPDLHVIVATANTRLTGEDLQALADRFALRCEMPRLMAKPDLRAVMLREVPVDGVTPAATSLPPLPVGLIASLRAHAGTVNVPRDVGDALVDLALAMRQPPPSGASYPDVSERRWIIATRLLQASATLAGRDAVDWQDLLDTLPAVLDNGPETRPAVEAAIKAALPPYVQAISDLRAACVAAVERARRVGGGGETPGIDPMRKGDGDGHAKLGPELDALMAPLVPFGADVIANGRAIADQCLTDADDAEESARIAKRAHRSKAGA